MAVGKFYIIDIKKWDERNKINFDVKYQRKFIWPERFQRSLIESIFKNYPIGSLITKISEKDGSLEVVDGHQRIKTILNFVNNKLSLNETHGFAIYNILLKKDNSEERKNYYKDKKVIKKFQELMEDDKTDFLNFKSINIETIEEKDEDKIREYFTLIQNQEAVKAGEIASNLPSLDIESFINYELIYDSMHKIGFKDERKEIIKLLIADYGYQNRKEIAIGSSDEEIIDFAKKINKKIYKGDFREKRDFKNHIEKSLHFLTRLDKDYKIEGPAKKRFIKLYLLIIHKLSRSDYINIKSIITVNKKMSEYNGKNARKNPENFKKNFIEEFNYLDNSDYDNFENLFYLFSSHTPVNNDTIKLIEFWKNIFILPPLR